MLTCKEVSLLASKKLDEKLTLGERVGFLLHISMCGVCRRYSKEINKVHALMLNVGKNGKSFMSESVKLSKEARERIKVALDKVSH
ncbi:MAG: hypothetical protein KAT04_08260 [Methylococcales bacterium]|nr:hypothetical protein [Methylococcales bacterium]